MLRFILRLFISIILLIYRRLPPEFSKKSSLKLLKFSFDHLNSLFSTYADKEKLEDDKFQLNGLSFKNNIGIAAGLDKEGKYFSALGSLGFGFIEVGTFTPEAQEGNKRPRIRRLKDQSIINRLGFVKIKIPS